MKKMNWLLLAMLLGILPALQSCDDNDGYSIGDIGRDWATVRVPSGNTYTLDGDTWGTIFPAATQIPWYKPTEGQRVVAYFNPLYDNYQGFDIGVKMNYIHNILTKSVEQLTADNAAEYGNDPVYIYKDGGLWISGGYLNVVFRYEIPTNGVKHRVSLVENTTATPANDGYIHLEYRYNTYRTDQAAYIFNAESAVSFNLNTLNITSATKGIKLKIHSSANGETEIVLPLKSNETASSKSIDFSTLTEDYLK